MDVLEAPCQLLLCPIQVRGWAPQWGAHLPESQSWGRRTRPGLRWVWQAGSLWRAARVHCSRTQVSGTQSLQSFLDWLHREPPHPTLRQDCGFHSPQAWAAPPAA